MEEKKALEKAEESYGKVPAAEYLKAREKAEARDRDFKERLREDYQMWMGHDGKFTVAYQCCCQDCGFEFSFKHEENVSLDGKEST